MNSLAGTTMWLADTAVPDPDGSVQPLLSDDPWWLMLVKALMVFVMLLLLTLFAIWFERRVVGRMQHRPGPNVNGPFGLLQSLADAVKLQFKEGIIPARACRWVCWWRSRSRRWVCTGSCSAAGRPGRRTRSSAACAPRRR